MRMHHIPLETHHLGAFHNSPRKINIIAILNKIWLFNTVSGVQMDASVTFQAQTLVSGGKEGFLEITRQTVEKSIHNVCSLYEL